MKRKPYWRQQRLILPCQATQAQQSAQECVRKPFWNCSLTVGSFHGVADDVLSKYHCLV
jgi:hypothetical protein